MPGSEFVGVVRAVIEWSALTIEILGAAVIVAVLGLLVLIRTFLGWSLAVEIEGRWPWQARREKVLPSGTSVTPDTGERFY